jgi:hypothetical protein
VTRNHPRSLLFLHEKFFATAAKRRDLRPLHRASRDPPAPASRGRKEKALSFPRCLCIRVVRTKATKVLPPRKDGEAERREARTEAAPAGAARATQGGCCHPLALRARSPLGAPPRLSRRIFRSDVAASGQVSWDVVRRALPRFSCPSPAEAPRAPVVVPADMMPEAARERTANPPAGTAPAPRSGVPREHVPHMSEMVCLLKDDHGESRTAANKNSHEIFQAIEISAVINFCWCWPDDGCRRRFPLAPRFTPACESVNRPNALKRRRDSLPTKS